MLILSSAFLGTAHHSHSRCQVKTSTNNLKRTEVVVAAVEVVDRPALLSTLQRTCTCSNRPPVELLLPRHLLVTGIALRSLSLKILRMERGWGFSNHHRHSKVKEGRPWAIWDHRNNCCRRRCRSRRSPRAEGEDEKKKSRLNDAQKRNLGLA